MSKFFTTKFEMFGELEFITVKSNALKKRVDITVFDSNKDDSSLRSLPVVILLHGVYSSHWAWVVKGQVHRTYQKLIDAGLIKPMVLVMPSDGLFGDGSGYLAHKTEDYEKWITEDLMEVTKENIPSVDDNSPVFITGLSMGGFGAMRIGSKNPQLYKAFSGLSSITHFDQMGEFLADFDELKRNALEQDGVLDWMLKNKSILPPFRFDCGSEDILIDYNRKLHKNLLEAEIPHIYEEFPGEHNWDYWTKYIENTLLFFNQYC